MHLVCRLFGHKFIPLVGSTPSVHRICERCDFKPKRERSMFENLEDEPEEVLKILRDSKPKY